MKTLKSDDYKNLHNGLEFTFDLKHNYYITSNISTNYKFDEISLFRIDFSWEYEFYFFDIHPFIGYGAGYLFLFEDSANLLFFKLNGGVLYHAYNLWKRLKIGTKTSLYLLAGTKKYLALAVSGVFFIRVEY